MRGLFRSLKTAEKKLFVNLLLHSVMLLCPMREEGMTGSIMYYVLVMLSAHPDFGSKAIVLPKGKTHKLLLH